MRVIYDGRLHVTYWQAYVEPLDPGSEDGGPDHSAAFEGQINGLLGAGQPGRLWLSTGVHSGEVGFRAIRAEEAPPLDPVWEDVVEVPFTPGGPSAVVKWGGGGVVCRLDLPSVPHRVRYSARGMDAGRAADVVMIGDPLLDHYELAFWPADPAPEEVVRRRSEKAVSQNGSDNRPTHSHEGLTLLGTLTDR